MEQAEGVWSGKFLMFKHEKEHTVLLYKIDEFYSEVFYDREYNSIRRLMPFKSNKLLKPYFTINNN